MTALKTMVAAAKARIENLATPAEVAARRAFLLPGASTVDIAGMKYA